MKPLTDSSFTAFVGIDWADTKHDICLQQPHASARIRAFAPPSGCHRSMGESLRQRFGQPIAVALNWPRARLSTHCRSTTS